METTATGVTFAHTIGTSDTLECSLKQKTLHRNSREHGKKLSTITNDNIIIGYYQHQLSNNLYYLKPEGFATPNTDMFN